MHEVSKNYTYAVVGASNNSQKYGHKVLADLNSKGFLVVPINPHEKQILGLSAYADISSCPQKIDVVIFVVPPKIAFSILQQAIKSGIKKFWFQPGSESKEANEFCSKNSCECITGSCIMLESK